MTKNLSRSGHKIYAWDMMPQAEQNCKDHVIIGADAKEICSKADMVITNITNTQAVHDFYVNQGYFDVIRKDAIICDTSTIDPAGHREIEKVAQSMGKTFIDCPMSGGVVGAEKGTLTFMCGTTDEAVFQKIQPVLLHMGKMAFNCKVVGGGQIAKACNNMALAIQMTSVAEALNLAQRLDLDPKVLSDIMCTATGRCWSVDTYNPVKGYIGGLPADRDFDNGFGIDLVIKDLTISTGAAAKVGANVEAGLLAKRKMEEMSAKGLGNKDFGYLYQWLGEHDAK